MATMVRPSRGSTSPADSLRKASSSTSTPEATLRRVSSPTSTSASPLPSLAPLRPTTAPDTLSLPAAHSHTLHLTTPATELRRALETSLSASGVDFEYNPAKFKANCYRHTSHGSAAFTVRCHAAAAENWGVPPTTPEVFLLQLTRRSGAPAVFLTAVDALLVGMVERGLLPTDGAARTRAAQLHALSAAHARAVAGAQGLPPLPPLALLDLPTLSPVQSSGLDEPHDPAADPHVPPLIFKLVEHLCSDFEDVAGPAAQSIAELTGTVGVRHALGSAAYLESEAGQWGHVGSTLLSALMDKVRNPLVCVSRPMTPRSLAAEAAVGAELRTAAAIALVHLARDSCGGVALARLHGPSILLDAVAAVPSCAATAGLRREAARAAGLVVAGAARDAGREQMRLLQHDCVRERAEALLRPPFRGMDTDLDACLQSIVMTMVR